MEMFWYLPAALTLCLSRLSVVQSGQCPSPYEECSCVQKSILCTGKGWTSLPKITDASKIGPVEVFAINDNKISSIPPDSIPKGVRLLELSKNPISDIAPTAFESSETTLNIIVMSGVMFTKLPDALLKLGNVTVFSLQDSAVEDWNPPVWNKFAPTLDTLDLQHAGLKSWPSWFKNLTKLSSLSLANNFITTIPDNAFDGLTDILLSLTINFPKLKHVPKALGILRKLEETNLDDCSFQDLSGIPKTGKLSLERTGIDDRTDLSMALIDTVDSLTHLSLDENSLTVIPDLSMLTKLEIVTLDENAIDDESSGSFPDSVQEVRLRSNKLASMPSVLATKPNLKTLKVSGNSISQIRAGNIPQQLSMLDVSSNNISHLNSDSFLADSEMKKLYLQQNPLSNISSTAFVNLKQLEILDISGTALNEVPLALAALDKLTMLNIQNMDSLSCSCPLPQALADWSAKRSVTFLNSGDSCKYFSMRSYLRGDACRTSTVTTSEAPTKDTTDTTGDSGYQIVCNLGSVIVCLFIILLIGR